MISLLIPKVSKQELLLSFALALSGALIAGCYGIIHDQVTFTLSPAYYYDLKFDQFSAFDFGWHPRLFAATIGFLATWWVGLICGWLIGRIAAKFGSFKRSYLTGLKTLGILIASVILSGTISYIIAQSTQTAENIYNWKLLFPKVEHDQIASFRTVGYIHNAGYIGGVIGLVLCCIWLRLALSKIRNTPS